MKMRPEVGASTPVITLISVDFPAPLSPIRPTISLRPMVSEMSLRARIAPKYFWTFSSRTMSRKSPLAGLSWTASCSKLFLPRPAKSLPRLVYRAVKSVNNRYRRSSERRPGGKIGSSLHRLAVSGFLQHVCGDVEQRDHVAARRLRIAVADRVEDGQVLVEREAAVDGGMRGHGDRRPQRLLDAGAEPGQQGIAAGGQQQPVEGHIRLDRRLRARAGAARQLQHGNLQLFQER